MYLGFDTSNYTTSVAVYDGVEIKQAKKVLFVKSGEKGLRQSDAVFQHTVNMPSLLNSLEINNIGAVGVSTRPRNIEGSYMPCFLVGVNTANAVSKAAGVPMYETSHQVGHILASLYSVNRLDLTNERFIAFHLSGGTTEALLVKPDESEIISAEIIAQSLDLKAGQAVDRTGVMLGLDFPCGKQLDLLSRECEQNFKIKPSMKGLDCSLSGVENKAHAMLENGASKQETAKFTLTYISQTICEMLRRIKREYGELPVVFSGGVASNSLLRQYVNNEFNAYFAQSEFSLDNAAGCAVYAYLKENRL
ncbi:MAG: peptidase M22 [Eubacteriales bacterium]|nr:peptidase M22 [Eubacteriales bacterium]